MDYDLPLELNRWFGFGAFRPGQREIIETVLQGEDTLAILPTGGGKSLTYQLPAMLLGGVTLVLSPLIALMKDQVESLPPAVAERTLLFNSTLGGAELTRRLLQLRNGQIKMVYAAPERLRQTPFLHTLQTLGVSLFVVDEAHCISQWGHDFRPDYRAVGKAVAALTPETVLAVTATATPEIADDIERQLGRPLHRLVRPTFRENLHLSALKFANEDEKQRAVLKIVQNQKGAGLIYAGSRDKCELLTRMLKRHRINADFYHAGLPPEARALAHERFMMGEVSVMVATVAFGMGIDKSDIRYIIHYNPSRSLENYYQEAGRAGRDGELSACTVLFATSDISAARRHAKEDTVSAEAVRAVYSAIRAALGKRRSGKRPSNAHLPGLPIPLESLQEATGLDEENVRTILPMLEELQVITRHSDLPRTFTLYPNEDVSATRNAEWEIFQPIVAGGGEFDSVFLADATGTRLPELEAVLLRLREDGFLSLRTGGTRDYLLELLPNPPNAKAELEALLTHRNRATEQRLEAMRDYLTGDACRHATIARYFGDTWRRSPGDSLRDSPSCGRCDYCTGERPDTGDVTAKNPAQIVPADQIPLIVLRLVAELTGGRSPFPVGKTGLMRILRAMPAAPVRPERTRLYGVFADKKRNDVTNVIEALLAEGYLRRNESDEYFRLYLTEKGTSALSTGDVTLPMTVKNESAPDATLLETLKAWRRQEATAEQVPPYFVFSDAVLTALAVHRPQNTEELLAVPGIGPKKTEKYGEAVLDWKSIDSETGWVTFALCFEEGK